MRPLRHGKMPRIRHYDDDKPGAFWSYTLPHHPLVSYMAVGDFIDFLNSVALVCKFRIFLFDEASQTHSDVQNEAL